MDRHPRSIVLVGMMGAGKSTVGALIARNTGMPLIDLDERIEKKVGASIADIFETRGEAAFRTLETAALADTSIDGPTVIVTGGGIVGAKENREHIKQLGTVVWLDADAEILYERATRERHRPLLNQAANPREAFQKLSSERISLYKEIVDIWIDTGHLSPGQVAEAVLQAIANQKAKTTS